MNLPVQIDDRGIDIPILLGEPNAEDVLRVFGLRRLMYVFSGLFVMLLLAASFVPIGAAVIGLGQVGVESRVKRIAHPTGGVISEIAVINGQHVTKGQLLMRLDDKVTGADATCPSSKHLAQIWSCS